LSEEGKKIKKAEDLIKRISNLLITLNKHYHRKNGVRFEAEMAKVKNVESLDQLESDNSEED